MLVIETEKERTTKALVNGLVTSHSLQIKSVWAAAAAAAVKSTDSNDMPQHKCGVGGLVRKVSEDYYYCYYCSLTPLQKRVG